MKLKVLVACEFSGVVREAFARRGWSAFSCDLLPTETPCKPGHHVEGDALEFLNNIPKMASGETFFDLIIAHPPCTFLCNSGVRWLAPGGTLNVARHEQMQEACDFFAALYWAPARHVCIENPVMHKYARDYLQSAWKVPRFTQSIQPWQFGHGEVKRTCLWLRNLPTLQPTNIVEGRKARVHFASPGPDRWKERSRTLSGIAEAMAAQWSNYLNSL